jgi:hypothetical protein
MINLDDDLDESIVCFGLFSETEKVLKHFKTKLDGKKFLLVNTSNDGVKKIVFTKRLYLSLYVLQKLSLEYKKQDMDLTDYYYEDLYALGKIGPGGGWLTTALEFLFSNSTLLKLHAVFHDSFGLFYRKFHYSNGYCYGLKAKNLPHFLRKNCLIGHVSGLFSIFKNKSLYKKEFSYLRCGEYIYNNNYND